MKRVFSLAALFAVMITPVSAQGDAATIPAEVFARLPDMTLPRLSPDGEQLAYVHHQGPQSYIVIYQLDTGSYELADATGVNVRTITWLEEDLLLLSVTNMLDLPRYRGPVRTGRILALDIGQMSLHEVGSRNNLTSLLSIDFEAVHLYSQGRGGLYRIDPRTDEAEQLAGRGGTYYFILNNENELVARINYDAFRDRLTVWSVAPNGDLDLVMEERTPLRTAHVVGVLPDGTLALQDEGEPDEAPDTRRLYSLPMDGSAERSVYYQDATYDLASLLTDPYSQEIIGVALENETFGAIWFDEELSSIQSALESALPGYAVYVSNWNRDRSRLVVTVVYREKPASYFLFDRTAGEVRPLGSLNPMLEQAGLPERRRFDYTARDGVVIPAFLTLPGTDSQGPLPFVIYPHGGPHSRDVGGFDAFAHFFASRGYGVIQPNFRGSSGYGRAWEDAGMGGWGRGVMQHDLTDAVGALIAQELADPDRICIVGSSYGGYAALAGAAFTPELYACAASINGVSDLERILGQSRRYTGRASETTTFWSRSIADGDSSPGAAYLRERSPRDHAAAITADVLLVHARDDMTVPVEQSRYMAHALENADISHRYIELEGGDHGLDTYEARVEALEALEAFLAEHLAD